MTLFIVWKLKPEGIMFPCLTQLFSNVRTFAVLHMSDNDYRRIISIDVKALWAPYIVYLPMCWKLDFQSCNFERAESLGGGIYFKGHGFLRVFPMNVQVLSPERG